MMFDQAWQNGGRDTDLLEVVAPRVSGFFQLADTPIGRGNAVGGFEWSRVLDDAIGSVGKAS